MANVLSMGHWKEAPISLPGEQSWVARYMSESRAIFLPHTGGSGSKRYQKCNPWCGESVCRQGKRNPPSRSVCDRLAVKAPKSRTLSGRLLILLPHTILGVRVLQHPGIRGPPRPACTLSRSKPLPCPWDGCREFPQPHPEVLQLQTPQNPMLTRLIKQTKKPYSLHRAACDRVRVWGLHSIFKCLISFLPDKSVGSLPVIMQEG